MESNRNSSWYDEFETGVAKIDKQFLNMFLIYDEINELKNSARVDYKTKMNRILSHLDKYAHEIADLDNSLIKTEDTDAVDAYVVNSQKLLTKVDDFILHFNSNNLTLIDQMLDFLRKWLMVQLLQARKVFLAQ